MGKTLLSAWVLVLMAALSSACGRDTVKDALPVPQASTRVLPVGILVKSHQEGELVFYDLQAKQGRAFKFPGITSLEPGEVVIAGGLKAGLSNLPIIYLEHNPQPGLKVNRNDVINPLVAADGIFQIAGAEGQALLAYSRVDNQPNGHNYQLFLGSLDQIENASPVVSHFDTKYLFVYNPLAVDADGSTIKGVWYTQTPWGVGGMGFPGNKGLKYFDVSSGQVLHTLSDDQNLQGFSPDHSLAAVMDERDPQRPVLRFVDIKTGKSTGISTQPANDLGAGIVRFSPGSRYVAWLEAGGTNMSDTPDYHSQLRVARLGEKPELVIDLTDQAVSEQLKLPVNSALAPADWLNDQTLLVDIQGEVYQLTVPEGKLSAFCPGSFVAFVYP
jgi:hypothetical protein